MKISRPIVLAALLAALVTSGCARDGDAPATEPAAPPPASASPDLPAVPSTDLPAPSKPAPGEAGASTLTGTVSAGVEPGCLVLDGHLLVFDDPALKSKAEPGAQVTVSGRADPGLMTTCQQGTPFLVTAVR